MTEHVCHLSDPWPTGHPLPPEDPARLTGPEVGSVVKYAPKIERYRDLVGGNLLVRIKECSYVWSPGECRSKGGYRHYDWSVIEWPVLTIAGNVFWKSMVVDDDDLAAAR